MVVRLTTTLTVMFWLVVVTGRVSITMAREAEREAALPGAGSARTALLPAMSRIVEPLSDRASTPV